jgi:RNA polymerase sigma-70 factor (ECF subfamily)
MVHSTRRLAAVHPLSDPTEGLSDEELVARIRADEARCERLLYLKHAGYVLSLCLRLLGHREEAEDAAQDIFLAVLEELASLREPSRLRPWIAQVAVHKVHRRFRRRKMLRALGLWGPPSQAVELLPAAAGASQEQAAELVRLSRVLATLDEVRAA